MAYFKRNQEEETRLQQRISAPEESEGKTWDWTDTGGRLFDGEQDYDDGFDALDADEDDEAETDRLIREEMKERLRKRVRILRDMSNLTGILVGTAVILLLLAFFFNMLHFVVSDITKNFTLFQTRL